MKPLPTPSVTASTAPSSSSPAWLATLQARLTPKRVPEQATHGRVYAILAAVSVALAALTLLYPSTPTYDPWAWIVWGREIIHFDLYRMISPEEFLDAGFREHFNHNSICIVEWPEKGVGVLPSPDIEVFLRVTSEQGREVELQALSEQGLQCLNRLKFAPNP